MPTFTKQLLSGSTNGRPIKVVATATLGTVIHTVSADIEEIWLYAAKIPGATVTQLTIELGDVTVPDDLLTFSALSQTLSLIVPGVPLSGDVVVTAFADVANEIMIVGWTNRIVP